MSNVIKIVLADDHSLIREGIKGLLEFEKDFAVIGEASSGFETIDIVKALKPDILLLDINMPGKNGIDVLKDLRSMGISTKILVLTIHDEVHYLRQAMALGANGYVLKDSDFNTLRTGIKEIMDGVEFIDKKLSAIFNEKVNVKESLSYEKMTKRELEILILISKGYINKEIAKKLSISEKTVKNHVFNLFKKIGVTDRTQAAVYAIKNNYVDI